MFEIVRFFYALLVRPLGWIVFWLALPVSEKARQLYRYWKRFPKELREVSKKHHWFNASMRIWVHAASIGEFESIRWIIEDSLKHDKKSVLVTYSSPNLGVHLDSQVALLKHPRFAKLFFPLDEVGRVEQILRMYLPTDFVLLQYEFWPNLLACVFQSRTIVSRSIVNYAPPKDRGLPNVFKLAFLHDILNRFVFIHQCQETPEQPILSPDWNLIHFSPHTRWATVKTEPHRRAGRQSLLRLVAGNVHVSDRPFLDDLFGFVAPLHYQLIWVPHDITPTNTRVISKQLARMCRRYSISYREHGSVASILDDTEPGVILVIQFGFLKDLYQNAHVAYVGGGFNVKGIHNLIEPLSCGCPIICGPRFHRQPVARWALKQGFLKSGDRSPNSFRSALGEFLALDQSQKELHKKILAARDTMRKDAKTITAVLPISMAPPASS